ncbi:hypothetical protein MGN70_014508 [Eutypa lata]|nr:hypothetical protein MGN70_014508 [Eutypa lata]
MAHRYSVGKTVKYMYTAGKSITSPYQSGEDIALTGTLLAINNDPPRTHEGTAKIIAIVPTSADGESIKYQVYDSHLDYTCIIVEAQIKEVLEQDKTSGEA